MCGFGMQRGSDVVAQKVDEERSMRRADAGRQPPRAIPRATGTGKPTPSFNDVFETMNIAAMVSRSNLESSSTLWSGFGISARASHDDGLNIRLRCSGGLDKYPAKAHARRVAAKFKQDDGVIVISASKNVNLPNSDMPAPFRQDRYFYYLSGVNEPDCYITYDLKADNLILWLPPVDNDWRHVVYYGNGSTVEEAMEQYDIDDARYMQTKGPTSASESRLAALIYAFWMSDQELGQHSRPCVIYLRQNYTWRSSALQTDSSALRRAMDACRIIKDEHEIRLIRKANEITAAAHEHVMKGMHKFTNEAEVEAAYMQTCIAQRAKEQAYDPIAGSGRNAAVLHYSSNLAEFGKAQIVVLDAGCEVERYGSDVTRTLPINKASPGHWPSSEAEEIYNLVEKVQEACIKQMLPGNKYIETQFYAHELVIEGLLELGILRGDPREIFHAGTSMAFLPHGLGHHLGLDVHDVSPASHPPVPHVLDHDDELFVENLRDAYVKWRPESAKYVHTLTEPEHFATRKGCHTLARPDAPKLEAGMVVTVEPGIYFNDFLLKRFIQDAKQKKFINAEVLQRYIPVGGVRIEDDILITKDGYENLTTAPKGQAMLKVIQNAAQVREWIEGK